MISVEGEEKAPQQVSEIYDKKQMRNYLENCMDYRIFA